MQVEKNGSDIVTKNKTLVERRLGSRAGVKLLSCEVDLRVGAKYRSCSVVAVTFDEKAGKNTLILRQLNLSKQALDGAGASGMEAGMRETFDQLEQLVFENQKRAS